MINTIIFEFEFKRTYLILKFLFGSGIGSLFINIKVSVPALLGSVSVPVGNIILSPIHGRGKKL